MLILSYLLQCLRSDQKVPLQNIIRDIFTECVKLFYQWTYIMHHTLNDINIRLLQAQLPLVATDSHLLIDDIEGVHVLREYHLRHSTAGQILEWRRRYLHH